ncbi:hypothetical protein Misp01_76460 [Microtetraspora sp. NBRC 13810]|uniref:hypothetical protein n=1 Tax=Microtetraspora sp. NBRC 13810 TaxID=3030990 RepID=UPI0024A5B197|nr:hypothetical protein [Microtetraspora sp. NBRC 13810]GLW12518.1 hypothetical protein Misp01_76460 [Microtetraspora sp. NBRC 13810]
MSTPTNGIADVATASGLPDDHRIRDLEGVSWHLFRPPETANPPVGTIGDLKTRTDADLKIPGFAAGRLAKLKAALIAASNGGTS